MEIHDYPKFMEDQVEEHFGIVRPIDDPKFPFPGSITHDIGRLKNGKFFFGVYVELNGVNDREGEVGIFDREERMFIALSVLAVQPDNIFDFTPEIAEELVAGYQAL